MMVLDTHALIWAHAGVRLSPRVQRAIADAGRRGELLVSAITPWEIALGAQAGKYRVVGDLLDWILGALDAVAATVAALEPAISVEAAALPWHHADPADRIIVATARRLGAVLVTADTRILDYADATKAVRVLEI
jgi:PIN domain nuclease of toxin-antitoxin system